MQPGACYPRDPNVTCQHHSRQATPSTDPTHHGCSSGGTDKKGKQLCAAFLLSAVPCNDMSQFLCHAGNEFISCALLKQGTRTNYQEEFSYPVDMIWVEEAAHKLLVAV